MCAWVAIIACFGRVDASIRRVANIICTDIPIVALVAGTIIANTGGACGNSGALGPVRNPIIITSLMGGVTKVDRAFILIITILVNSSLAYPAYADLVFLAGIIRT